MRQQTVKNRRGFSLTELGVVLVLAPIVMLSMGLVLADNQRGWNQMYNRLNNGLATDGFVARKSFDAVVRKSSINYESFGDGEVEVHYYADSDSSTYLDRYARFYKDDTELLIEYGQLDSSGNPTGILQTVTLCDNVEAVNFSQNGACLQMVLRLNDGSESLTVMTAAIRQSESQ
jgi:hypothetical protein